MSELLRFDSIFHHFEDGKSGLHNICLSIDDGEFLVLAGRNGSGKTLLMHHAVGLAFQSEGKMLFRGKPVHKHLKKVRSSIGYVFQDADAQIVGQTIAEDAAFGPGNLGLSLEEIKNRVDSALLATGLEKIRNQTPDTLSGGEKRRLAIAGILAMEPSCLILDEPFTNLDYPSIKAILSVIVNIHKSGKTVILLTHELEKVLAHATRLVVLESGKIVFDGNPDNFPSSGFEAYGLIDPWRKPACRSDLSWL